MELEGKARNIVRRRKDNIMMNDKQRVQVYNILLTPIEFFSEKYKESNVYPDYIIEETNIFIDKNVIKSTQSYYPYYPDLSKKRYPFSPDCDMSDFSCGFYEIIYKDILIGQNIVDEDGNFTNKIFAGDTMNTGIISKHGRKSKLSTHKRHCLANFWILPMWIGRDWGKNPHPEHSKTRNNCNDYIELYLEYVKDNWDVLQKNENVGEYFLKFKNFNDFMDKHYISDNVKSEKIQEQIDFIKDRAKAISESKHTEELWEYFFENGLFGYKETYLEPDEYPLNKEIHPYAYECPKCNRTIANDENYSIPDMCDECSKKN
jgi:hypothetical protein